MLTREPRPQPRSCPRCNSPALEQRPTTNSDGQPATARVCPACGLVDLISATTLGPAPAAAEALEPSEPA